MCINIYVHDNSSVMKFKSHTYVCEFVIVYSLLWTTLKQYSEELT